MKFEKMLKNSAKLANEEWMNSLPKEPAKHEFSERFEWKIRKIPEQHFIPTHPFLEQVPKYAACFLLLAFLSFNFIFATDVNARNSIREWFEENILHIEYEGDGSFSGLHFEPALIPEGYHFERMTEMQNMTFLDYINEQGGRITLYYGKGAHISELEIDSDAAFLRVNIQNNPGYVQIYGNEADKHANKNNITWFDEKNNIIFSILGPLDETELIRMAQSITEQMQ